MATRHNLRPVRRGDTLRAELRLKADGLAADLTGSDMQVIVRAGGATITKSSAAGTLDVIAASGIVRLVLSSAETSLLPTGRPFAWYELKRVIGTEVTTLLEGTILAREGGDDGQ